MYEIAAGRDVSAYIRTLEQFASETGMLPEQIWDEASLPECGLERGRSTGAAQPLMWAHAEYIRLLRSVHDGKVFDLVEPVRDRYLRGRTSTTRLEVWKFNRQVAIVAPGSRLRILAGSPFKLRYSLDGWQNVHEAVSLQTALSIGFVDLDLPTGQAAPCRFTFYWLTEGRWEGRDFSVSMQTQATFTHR